MNNQKKDDVRLVVAFGYQQKEFLEARIKKVIDVDLSQEYTPQVILHQKMAFVLFPESVIQEETRNWKKLLYSLCEVAITDKCFIITRANNHLDVCSYQKEEFTKDHWQSIKEPFEEFLQTLREQNCEIINLDEVVMRLEA